MESKEWLILVLGIVIFVGLWMFVRGHIYLTMERFTPDPPVNATATQTPPSQRRPAKAEGPAPADKYLPVWVILSMALAVGGLAWQINSIVTSICKDKGRCQTVQVEAEKNLEQAKKIVAAAEATKASEPEKQLEQAKKIVADSEAAKASAPKSPLTPTPDGLKQK